MNLDNVLERLEKSYLSDDEKKNIGDWLKENTPALANVAATEVRYLLIAMQQGQEQKLEYYKELVAKMTWDERIQLMKLSAEELRQSTSPNLNLAAILVAASEIAVKLLPILIAII